MIATNMQHVSGGAHGMQIPLKLLLFVLQILEEYKRRPQTFFSSSFLLIYICGFAIFLGEIFPSNILEDA
jgi:hypothetical protein